MQEELLRAAQHLVDEAKDRALTFGFAESCTAGLCSACVGSIPGASSAFAGGIVSYMLSVKERVLGVPGTILYDEKLGPVSSECAQGMALGAREALGCDVCVSVTGLAGPDGAEEGKPIGTVWFGYASKDKIFTKLVTFVGTRDEIRAQAACLALDLMREGIMEISTRD